jgi:hypothetical protein
MNRTRLNPHTLFPLIAAVALLSITLVGCGLESRSNYKHEVEIAPGKWLTLKERRGYCWFVCEYNGKKVTWKGKRDTTDELELPDVLREHDGNLYMIVFNREDMESMKYVYFKLGSSGEKFEEILPSEFPKQVAIENMVGEIYRMVGVGNQWVDTWEMLRKLDFESPAFNRSATANIWIELETGKSFKEFDRKLSYEERRQVIRNYAAKHKPVPVPTLVEEEEPAAEKQQRNGE